MPTLRIEGLRTMNQLGQNATLFHPYSDALALTLDIRASADLLALPGAGFVAEYQIFDPHTHKVVVSYSQTSAFTWGGYFWMSLGNNWGPPSDYTTPERWGLSWNANSVFGFRGIVRSHNSPTPGSGYVSVDAFDVSPMRWFRVRELYRL